MKFFYTFEVVKIRFHSNLNNGEEDLIAAENAFKTKIKSFQLFDNFELITRNEYFRSFFFCGTQTN